MSVHQSKLDHRHCGWQDTVCTLTRTVLRLTSPGGDNLLKFEHLRLSLMLSLVQFQLLSLFLAGQVLT